MKTLVALALSAALLSGALGTSTSNAEEVVLNAPLSGVTLNSNQVAMSVYYSKTNGDDLEVTVTYVGDNEPNQPHRMVMALADGNCVGFGLPGYPGTIYEFARKGNVVSVTDKTVVPHSLARSDI